MWLLAQMAECLNDGKRNIKEAKSKSMFLLIVSNFTLRFK